MLLEPYLETGVHSTGTIIEYRPMMNGNMWRFDGAIYDNSEPDVFTCKKINDVVVKKYYLTPYGANLVREMGGIVRGEFKEVTDDAVAIAFSEDEIEKYYLIGRDEVVEYLPNDNNFDKYGKPKYKDKYLASIAVALDGTVDKTVYFWKPL